MITKEEVQEIGKNYLRDKKIEYESLYPIDKIGYIAKKRIPFGKKKDEQVDIYHFHFTQLWGLEERGLSLYIDAHSGEPLYIMTPHGYLDVEE